MSPPSSLIAAITCKSLDPQIGIDHLDSVSSVSPTLWSKGAEGEHCLIKINNSSIRLLHLLYECAHSMKEWEIMRLREINLSLSSLDILEPDLVLKIDATNGCGRNFHFSKPSVKHLCAFDQWQMSAFLKSLGWDEITNLMLLELWARVILLRETMNWGTNCCLDQLNDCWNWLPDNLCNWCIIHHWLW